MRILHLMLACFYIDDYSYQENLLPKYHKLQGHEVEIVSSLFSFDKNGKGVYLESASKYLNKDGIPVTRLEYSFGKVGRKFRKYKGLLLELNRIHPDLIFVHGVQFADVRILVNYLKNHNDTIVYVDNHSDFSNSATNFFSRTILHGIIWKHYAQIINPYVKTFYGVLPARVDFLINIYGIPKEKVELLVMGADDERVEQSLLPEVRRNIREKLKLSDEDFVIMTGGKIDQFKTQTLLLMEAVHKLKNPSVRLVVFGSVTPELIDQVQQLSDGHIVNYIGWIQATESYDYFAAADLVVFPGRHSVFWEQVVAQGIPMIVKYWDGTTHIDCGGNVVFLPHDTVEDIKNAIKEVLSDGNYSKMKMCALNAKEQFLYSKIAEKSIN